MRHYKYLQLKNKVLLSRYVIHHCAIFDVDSGMVYHLTNPGGYIVESIDELMKRYYLVDCIDFYSDRDIEQFMYDYQKMYGDYNTIENNCEMFANDFYGEELSQQNRFYDIMGLLALSVVGVLMFNDKK